MRMVLGVAVWLITGCSTDEGDTDEVPPQLTSDTESGDTGSETATESTASTGDTGSASTTDTGVTGTTGSTGDTGPPPLFPEGDHACYGYVDIDLGADGVVDILGFRGLDDVFGELVYEGHDRRVDGTIDYVHTVTLDAAGRPTLKQWDEGADGSIESEEGWVYDVDGQVVEHWEDTWRELITPGPDGPTERLIDDNGDGVSDTRYTYTYDLGALTRVETDYGLDGVDSVTTYVNDAQGRPIRSEGSSVYLSFVLVNEWTYLDANDSYDYVADNDGDGSWDYTSRTLFDADGQTVQFLQDVDANGVIDMDVVTTWHPDGYGRLTYQGFYETGGLRFDYDYAWDYDPDGRQTLEDVHVLLDGSTQQHDISTTTWSCP